MRFLNDERANVALILAISLLPLMMMSVLAIEFGRQQGLQRQATSAIDATVLAVALERQSNGDALAPLQGYAESYFLSNLGKATGATYDPIRLTLTPEEVIAAVDVHMPSAMLGLFGVEQLNFTVSAAAVSAQRTQLEVIMVLDVSNSMSGPRIAALQDAAGDLVNSVLISGNRNIRIGIVPFNEHVNVGLVNTNQPWLDVQDDDELTFGTCPIDAVGTSAQGCTVREQCADDARIGSGSEGCFRVPTCPAGVEPVRFDCDLTAQRIWQGCVGSRPRPLHVQDTGFTNARVPGLALQIDRTCFAENELLELTHVAAELREKIRDLRPVGRTYLAPGIAWGLRALSSEPPLTSARLSGRDNGQIMIIFTDGSNTSSLNEATGRHDLGDIDAANRDTEEACNEVKNADIEIYTIAFGINDTDTETLLRRCATSDDNYFEANTENQLSTIFQGIAGSIRSIALSK